MTVKEGYHKNRSADTVCIVVVELRHKPNAHTHPNCVVINMSQTVLSTGTDGASSLDEDKNGEDATGNQRLSRLFNLWASP